VRSDFDNGTGHREPFRAIELLLIPMTLSIMAGLGVLRYSCCPPAYVRLRLKRTEPNDRAKKVCTNPSRWVSRANLLVLARLTLTAWGKRYEEARRIGLLGSFAAAWPLKAEEQQQLRTIAIVGNTTQAYGPWVAAFIERFSQLGWTEGRTIQIEYRWSEGRRESVAEIASELVGKKVDLIVTMEVLRSYANRRLLQFLLSLYQG
jgi:hypothetical protein